MPAKTHATNQCQQCGEAYEPGTIVCTHCHAILLVHSQKSRPPAWVIALLIAIIIGMLCVIVYMCNQIFVLHKF